MRDEDYVKIMLEAYRDVLSEILSGKTVLEVNQYVLEQVKFFKEWKKEMSE